MDQTCRWQLAVSSEMQVFAFLLVLQRTISRSKSNRKRRFPDFNLPHKIVSGPRRVTDLPGAWPWWFLSSPKLWPPGLPVAAQRVPWLGCDACGKELGFVQARFRDSAGDRGALVLKDAALPQFGLCELMFVELNLWECDSPPSILCSHLAGVKCK